VIVNLSRWVVLLRSLHPPLAAYFLELTTTFLEITAALGQFG
jgi:hypothetical protein